MLTYIRCKSFRGFFQGFLQDLTKILTIWLRPKTDEGHAGLVDVRISPGDIESMIGNDCKHGG